MCDWVLETSVSVPCKSSRISKPGPHLQAARRKITPLGGGSTYLQAGIAKQVLELEYLTVSGTDDARRAVRENLAMGADLIKVQMEARAGAFWKFRYMAPEDAQAIAQDAHRLRMKVAVHAVDKADIQIAVDAGADSVEHAFQATDAELQAMKDKGFSSGDRYPRQWGLAGIQRPVAARHKNRRQNRYGFGFVVSPRPERLTDKQLCVICERCTRRACRTSRLSAAPR